jgi:ribosomal protein S18 acetylase RimI-like enzyme
MTAPTNTDLLTIKKAEPADVPGLVSVINACYRGEGSKQGWTTEADLIAGDIRTDEADVGQLMAKETATFLKCEHPTDGIVGTVFLDKIGEKLYLGMFSVDTRIQGSGIGKRMLAAAETHAESLGCSAIFMQVISLRKELIAWYERFGYRLTGEVKPFDGDERFGKPRMPLEFAKMEKKLA